MKIIFSTLVIISLFLAISCKEKKTETEETQPTTTTTGGGPSVENTLGFGVLNKIKGIWNGPVSSTTPLGGYPEWIVDFRPITENQIAAKNELDTLNDIFMSFFCSQV